VGVEASGDVSEAEAGAPVPSAGLELAPPVAGGDAAPSAEDR
jgi:hypothetical protein